MNIKEAVALRGEVDSYERQENLWILEHILQRSVLELKLLGEFELTAKQQQDYVQALERIGAGEPLAYITGSQPFWSLDLIVTPDTLVPRPDTEVLVESVLQLDLAQYAKVVDLGTGTGAVALSLASERPSWQILATDIYEPTLAVAQRNANKHGLKQVKFACGVWYDALAIDDQAQFDVIVSNPPYIDRVDPHMQSLRAEPERALVADLQGMADLQLIIQQAVYWLKPQGWVVLEHGYDQGQAVRTLFEQTGFKKVKTIQDYAGKDRVSLGQLITD
ncbi:peptide chain release factor N(5)-glutamine methyltransferase [Acinetobacter rudis]|uniref:Release factor glutamine methyltransferase n=1 Tax=Acinetobacter rudis TaxID=632955 RepID=A0AAW8JA18_9GAMM|nr:peptide chain release factor N(5)-glutamine methyltransferase [Acinetobacter rudis]MDQ8936014.1 peptide chain release factor N(5)-glutamine methyltransferase [Acinetobacter rudis]MDQ9018277.1 peptide chain release factor N(5)-glutamine methyltransferase [Acinetobacter rudis]